jgi:hypothetical protein
MHVSNIAITTITLARSVSEERSLRRSIKTLVTLGLPVVVADGGSRVHFVEQIESLGCTMARPKSRGLVAQVKASLATALRVHPASFVLYTEPDKAAFFSEHLVDFIHSIRIRPGLAMVLAARDSTSFRTFPKGQQWTEQLMNGAAQLLFGKDGDYCYGPILLSRDAAELALSAPEDLGWGWRFWLLRQVARRKLHFRIIEMNSPCPDDQRGEDRRADRIYRVRQLRQNLNGLLLCE